jgi:hypothetical protein
VHAQRLSGVQQVGEKRARDPNCGATRSESGQTPSLARERPQQFDDQQAQQTSAEAQRGSDACQTRVDHAIGYPAGDSRASSAPALFGVNLSKLSEAGHGFLVWTANLNLHVVLELQLRGDPDHVVPLLFLPLNPADRNRSGSRPIGAA